MDIREFTAKNLRDDDIANRSQIITGVTDLVDNAQALVGNPPQKKYRFDCQFLLKNYFDGRIFVLLTVFFRDF